MKYPYEFADLKHAACGNWQHILSTIGIPSGCLKDKHQPCPICGGKDRFRFDNKQGFGTYYCNQCGSGDGFAFVMTWQQCDFPTAAQTVARILGMDTSPKTHHHTRPTPTPSTPESEPDQLPKLQRIWHETQPLSGSQTLAYLAARGLDTSAITDTEFTHVRHHAALPYWTQDNNGKPIKLGEFGAMIGAIVDTNGELQGLHTTYLHPNQPRKLAIVHPETGEPLPNKKMQRRYSGSLKGCAVPLDPLDNTRRLLVCEGMKTAFAARELFALPTWACLNAGNLAAFHLPDGVNSLLIVADHDTPRPIGFQAAHDLATRALKQGLKVQIWQPETQGFDGLDELNRIKKEQQS